MIRLIDCSTMICNWIRSVRLRRHLRLSFVFVSHCWTPSHRSDTVRVRLLRWARPRRSSEPRVCITLCRRVRLPRLRRRSSISSVRRVPISRWSTRSHRSSARSVRRCRRNVDLVRRRILFHSISPWTNVRRHRTSSLRKRNGFERDLLLMSVSLSLSTVTTVIMILFVSRQRAVARKDEDEWKMLISFVFSLLNAMTCTHERRLFLLLIWCFTWMWKSKVSLKHRWKENTTSWSRSLNATFSTEHSDDYCARNHTPCVAHRHITHPSLLAIVGIVPLQRAMQSEETSKQSNLLALGSLRFLSGWYWSARMRYSVRICSF
jgi:hypothetical protein